MKKQRRTEEGSENLPEVQSEVPAAKFQGTQQVAPSTGFNSDTGSSKFTLEKKKAPGSQLKQDIASSVVRDSALTGGSAGDGASFSGAKSSGSTSVGIAGVGNATPNVGKPSRSDYRTGKKLDRNSNKLNYIPSDQVLTEWDESKPLADAADLDQGFNGTYRNEFARSQKKNENVPGALMFERSVDLICKDKIYFGRGQYVKQTGVDTLTELKYVPYKNVAGIYKNPDPRDDEPNYAGGTYGNYLATAVHYKFDHNGKLLYFYFDETDLTPSVDAEEANKSSLAATIDRNRFELIRESMDSKAGDEKADIWTPLARADAQPTATIGFLETMEADVGNELITAYRKSLVCHSYQLNRAHKDGQEETAPGIYASAGINHNYVSSEYAREHLYDMDSIFEYDAVAEGLPSTMIALYDSPRKYNTKADFIIQPRSYRMHLQTADNNMDPLHADKKFIAIYDNQECFSTIDREYDPSAPVFMTDRCNVIHRLSWNKQGAFMRTRLPMKLTTGSDRNSSVLATKGMCAAAKALGLNAYFIYWHEASGSVSYSNGVLTASNTYEAANGNPVLIFAAEEPDYEDDTTADNYQELITIANNNLPTTTGITLSFKGTIAADWADYDEEFQLSQPASYMYEDLRNAYRVVVNHPMLKGLRDYLELSVGQKYYDVSNGKDITVPVVHSTQFFSLWSLLLCAATPFIVKARINSFRDILYYEKNVEYPFNDALVALGDVKTKAYTNFGFVDKDTELEVKRMTPATAIGWILPETLQQVGRVAGAKKSARGAKALAEGTRYVLLPWYTSQNELTPTGFDHDKSAMSMPSIRSGVRFAALDSLYSMTEKDLRLCLDMVSSWGAIAVDAFDSVAYKYSAVGDGQICLPVSSAGITAAQWLTLPRQLGYVVDAPYGVLTPKYDGTYGLNDDIIGTTGYRATYWLGMDACTHTVDEAHPAQSILAATEINIERAANFRQQWFTILASGTTPTIDHGFLLSTNQLFGSTGGLLLGESTFKPFAALDDSGAVSDLGTFNPMISLQKALWTRLQKLPFILSPFDLRVIDNTGATPNAVTIVDPYDMMYWFGLGGFRASDFRESVYNREKEMVNQGYLFVSDPWVEASPLFKEGSLTGGVSMSKGFEL